MTKEKVKVPKRIEILPNCQIMGCPETDVVLGPGTYVLNKNMTEAMAIQLSSDEFSHCVRILSDKPAEPKLGQIGEAPKATPGYIYSRRKQHEAELAEYERVHGKSVRKPEHLKQNE